MKWNFEKNTAHVRTLNDPNRFMETRFNGICSNYECEDFKDLVSDFLSEETNEFLTLFYGPERSDKMNLWLLGGDLFLEKVGIFIEEQIDIYEERGLDLGELEFQLKVMIINGNVQVEETTLTLDNFEVELRNF